MLLLALVVSLGVTGVASAAEPVVTEGSVTTNSLPPTGGWVVISGKATDDQYITGARAEITSSNGFFGGGFLAQTGVDTFANSFYIPGNSNDYPEEYTIVIFATDPDGAEGSQWVGTVTVDPQPPFDEPPSIWDPLVEPRELGSTGGQVSLAATAFDTRGVSEVYATVDRVGGGSSTQVSLETGDLARYTGTTNIAANTTSTPVKYHVTFSALDDIGQETQLDGGEITVAAVPAGSARLQVSPTVRSFGGVPVGTEAERTVTIRNIGGRAVSGYIHPIAPPFAVGPVGTVAGIPFTLQPGTSTEVVVRFRPSSYGYFSRTLRVRRTDGQQSNLGVTLTGLGTTRRR
ncbi:MAG: choice-of-anchor D domain-containing protein [Solirubrobacteraceae bacterium]|nr:choice-of-anchor D domain-containing protein [Solirubrobacteraceae bacterium]